MRLRLKMVKSFGVVTPHSGRESRLHSFFQRRTDWFPLHTWPLHIQASALKEHKRNRERYVLFCFFVFNGLRSVDAIQWIRAADYIDGQLVFAEYDSHAERHFVQLRNQYLRGTLGNIRVYDIISGRTIPHV